MYRRLDGRAVRAESEAREVRVIVCGSRRWRDRYAIANRLFDLPDPASVVIVHGGAQGADRIAMQEVHWDGRSTGTKHMLDQAEAYGIPTEVHYRPEAA
ncbi:MAG TPA: SLOG family protein [Gemmatimonadales bacterium]|nr:SLOG family protein [Gemmatimonadales bacterium]